MSYSDYCFTPGPANRPERISDVIDYWVARFPERVAVVDDSGHWTYAALSSAIVETRRWLMARGLGRGDRLMVIGENCRAVVALILAAAQIDVWVVIISPRLSAREIDEIRTHCDPRHTAYVFASSVLSRLHAARDHANSEGPMVLGPLALSKRNENAIPEDSEGCCEDGVAVIIYTSGSSGRPKGVMLTHRNLLFMAAVSGTIRSLTPDDRIYAVLPLSHIVGLAVVLLGGLMRGASIHLAPRFNPAEFSTALLSNRLTIVLGTPMMLSLLLEYTEQKGIKTLMAPALRIISVSGAPLEVHLKRRAERLFGIVVHQGYGITECSPTIAQTRPGETVDDYSVGPIIPGIDVRVLGPNGEPVMAGETGELWVRGPNVMKGYYKDPKETNAVLTEEGWFNTRDLVRFEGDNLIVVGRTRELIIRYGFNVYPAEVEAVLNSHPDVKQSAVVGRKRDGTEEIVAFVEPMPETKLTVEEVANHAASLLSPYKRPSEIFFLTTLPSTPSGKVRKSELENALEKQGAGPR